MKFNNKKKIILGSIITLILIISLGVTYAFFTFGKTSLNSQLVAGDIYMQYKETNSINIPDMMPRSTYVDNENGYFEFQITGKNTYAEKDIIYDVVLSYGDTPTDPNRTIRIKDELLRFRLVKVVNNEEQEIFNNRSYTSINNTRIHKETIPAETNSEITTTYRIYAWISEETKIGNTEDADYSLSDWNKVFASIKVNVTGDFNDKLVPKGIIYDIVKTGAQSDATISNLYAKEGVGNFLRSTTASDPYPIYYYRGNVENNNVVFANKCWKIVRTTETGGTKLIYNGEPIGTKKPLSQIDYTNITKTGDWTFDSNDSSWNISMETNVSSSSPNEISFNVPTGYGYVLQITGISTTTGGVSGGVFKGGSQVNGFGGGSGSSISLVHTYGTLTTNASNLIKVTYYVTGGNSTSESPSTLKIKMMRLDASLGYRCSNTGSESQISQTRYQDINKSESPAYVGYNYGQVYENSTANWTSGARFGSSYTWDGTNYKLVDATKNTPDSTHRYSCNLTDPNASCSSLRYVNNIRQSTTKYYITLKNGKGVEDALKEMLSESTDTNKSNIQNVINSWYTDNIKTNYEKYIEDTAWCNDRSVSTENLGGWNAKNSSANAMNMYFDAYIRIEIASASNPPVLTCSNANDVMSVANRKLDNPVALLTYDEVSLAGVQKKEANSSSYLNSGSHYWLLSPMQFGLNAIVGAVNPSGTLGSGGVNDTVGGVRPALSLKHGTLLYDGDGTVANPYIVGTPLT